MPNPLKQYEKILSRTNFSFTTTFRGCVHGETISDLDVGYFIEEKGKYFMNIINFTDVILIGIKMVSTTLELIIGAYMKKYQQKETKREWYLLIKLIETKN